MHLPTYLLTTYLCLSALSKSIGNLGMCVPDKYTTTPLGHESDQEHGTKSDHKLDLSEKKI